MIYVIGDSHSRAFARNSNFFPMFIGAGKENNFVSEKNFQNLQDNVLKIVKLLPQGSQLLLVFGEPDCRFFTGQGWYPWLSEVPPNIQGYQERVKESVDKYHSLLSRLKALKFNIMVMCVTPSLRTEQNIIVDYFNYSMIEICRQLNILFIDVNNEIYTGNSDVIKNEFFGDTVHLNNKLQLLVEKVLLENKIILNSRFTTNKDWKHEEIMSEFEFDSRFGCYKQKNVL